MQYNFHPIEAFQKGAVFYYLGDYYIILDIRKFKYMKDRELVCLSVEGNDLDLQSLDLDTYNNENLIICTMKSDV